MCVLSVRTLVLDIFPLYPSSNYDQTCLLLELLSSNHNIKFGECRTSKLHLFGEKLEQSAFSIRVLIEIHAFGLGLQ